MRAVNLIPADQRRGAGGLAGRSGGVVYVLTGGLLVLVGMGVVYASAVHGVATNEGKLASVTEQVAAVNAQTQALQPYVAVAALSQQKLRETAMLAAQRFNWPSAMQQLALALPADVTFTTFSATVAGASPATGAAASPVPAAAPGAGAGFALSGCASTQAEMATVLTNLAAVPGVSNVRLINTVKTAAPSKKLAGRAAVNSAVAKGGTCPYVTFSLGLDYSASYTIPNSKALKPSSGGAQTVSNPTSGTSSIAKAGTTQAAGGKR
jgi:Tfp pilus assembly protein PilN